MDCSLPGSSVHGIFQERTLEWVAISSYKDLPDPGIKPVSLALAGRFFTTEPPGKPCLCYTVSPYCFPVLCVVVLLPGKSHGWRGLVGCSHGVAKSQTRLSDFTFTFHSHALDKEMATHSSVLSWRIPGTGKPGGLPSMVSHRVGYNWSDLAAVAAAAVCIC